MATKTEYPYGLTRQERKRIRAWVAALRGGRFRQGRETLRPADRSFCCLGVACNISDNRNWKKIDGDWVWDYKGLYAEAEKAWEDDQQEEKRFAAAGLEEYPEPTEEEKQTWIMDYIVSSDEGRTELPNDLLREMGLHKIDVPGYTKGVGYTSIRIDLQARLIAMNDDGCSFKEIADEIEKIALKGETPWATTKT